MWVACTLGLTHNLQQLIFLSFVACRTRQVGARFDGEPSEGKTIEVRGASQAERESTVIACQREPELPVSLSPEPTETPRPLLVQQDTISDTTGTATVHTNLDY